MPYLLLIHEPHGQRAERGEAQGRVVFQRMVDFAEALKAEGKLLAVESLSSPEGASRVQVRGGGKATVLDGPFAEAKEFVGGFFLLDCASQAEAVEIAGRCPAAQWATVEVRQTGPCFT